MCQKREHNANVSALIESNSDLVDLIAEAVTRNRHGRTIVSLMFVNKDFLALMRRSICNLTNEVNVDLKKIRSAAAAYSVARIAHAQTHRYSENEVVPFRKAMCDMADIIKAHGIDLPSLYYPSGVGDVYSEDRGRSAARPCRRGYKITPTAYVAACSGACELCMFEAPSPLASRDQKRRLQTPCGCQALDCVWQCLPGTTQLIYASKNCARSRIYLLNYKGRLDDRIFSQCQEHKASLLKAMLRSAFSKPPTLDMTQLCDLVGGKDEFVRIFAREAGRIGMCGVHPVWLRAHSVLPHGYALQDVLELGDSNVEHCIAQTLQRLENEEEENRLTRKRNYCTRMHADLQAALRQWNGVPVEAVADAQQTTASVDALLPGFARVFDILTYVAETDDIWYEQATDAPLVNKLVEVASIALGPMKALDISYNGQAASPHAYAFLTGLSPALFYFYDEASMADKCVRSNVRTSLSESFNDFLKWTTPTFSDSNMGLVLSAALRAFDMVDESTLCSVASAHSTTHLNWTLRAGDLQLQDCYISSTSKLLDIVDAADKLERCSHARLVLRSIPGWPKHLSVRERQRFLVAPASAEARIHVARALACHTDTRGFGLALLYEKFQVNDFVGTVFDACRAKGAKGAKAANEKEANEKEACT